MSTIDLTEVGTDGTMPVKSESLDNNVLCVDALTISQQDAIENATRVIQKYGGVNLFGKVGSGKTRTALAAIETHSLKANKSMVALIIMPKMGGVVFEQTMSEGRAIGIAERMFVLSDNDVDAMKLKVATAKSKIDSGCIYIVTNIQRLDALSKTILQEQNSSSVSKGKRVSAKNFSLEERRRARDEMLRRLGKFDVLWLDEFHKFAPASPRTDANVEVDQTLSQYPIIDQLVTTHKPSCVIGTSGTPFSKYPNDIWAFIRLFSKGRIHKRQIMIQTKFGTTEERGEFNKTCNFIANELSVVLKHDETPASTKLHNPHTLSDREATIHASSYQELNKASTAFLRAVQSTPQFPTSDQRAYYDFCKNRFCIQYMLCKRGACHPGLFATREMPESEQLYRAKMIKFIEDKGVPLVPMTQDDLEFEDLYRQVKDMGNNVSLSVEEIVDSMMRHCKIKFTPRRDELTTWRQKVKDNWPLADCHKFARIISRLAEISDERTLIMFEYTQIIQLLALYIKEAFPTRRLFVYHGELSDSVRLATLAAFKTSEDDAILLSTRGALSMAVNVEFTTLKTIYDEHQQPSPCRHAVRMFFGDFAESLPDQDQAEGRCKRPKSQGYPNDADRVQNWFVEYFRATDHTQPTIETALDKMLTVKAMRCANLLGGLDKGDGEEYDAPEEEFCNAKKTQITVIIETLSSYGGTGNVGKRKAGETKERGLPKRKR
jgi:hypothetical protein